MPANIGWPGAIENCCLDAPQRISTQSAQTATSYEDTRPWATMRSGGLSIPGGRQIVQSGMDAMPFSKTTMRC
jgi:hypothetical protein